MENEVWKKIDEFPNYEVSTFGNVRNITTGKILKQCLSGGYKSVSLCQNDKQKTMQVHRLVALTFISNPENKETVNHKDHNPSNNNIENLEWYTRTEQNRHQRQPSKKVRELINARKVWRVDKMTNEKLELYQSITMAEQWLIDNKLTISKIAGRLGSKISKVLNGKKTTAYGYKWIYEDEENLTNEIWKEIPKILVNGVEGYYISSLGRVKTKKGIITSGSTNIYGYLVVTLGKKTFRLHRLVAQVFLPNPENKQIVNHKDGNKANAKLSNLEWVTPSENSNHAIETGLINIKSIIQYDLNMNKLNEFKSQKEAADKLNINYRSIGMCCSGTYKTAGGFVFKFKDDNNINFEPVILDKPIIQYDKNMNKLNEFKSQIYAADKLNISYSSINKCCNEKLKTAGGFIFRFKN